MLADPRVTHFWDEERITSRWAAEFRPDLKGLLHADAFALFGPDARWDAQPSSLVAAAPNVIGRSSELKAAIEPLL